MAVGPWRRGVSIVLETICAFLTRRNQQAPGLDKGKERRKRRGKPKRRRREGACRRTWWCGGKQEKATRARSSERRWRWYYDQSFADGDKTDSALISTASAQNDDQLVRNLTVWTRRGGGEQNRPGEHRAPLITRAIVLLPATAARYFTHSWSMLPRPQHGDPLDRIPAWLTLCSWRRTKSFCSEQRSNRQAAGGGNTRFADQSNVPFPIALRSRYKADVVSTTQSRPPSTALVWSRRSVVPRTLQSHQAVVPRSAKTRV